MRDKSPYEEKRNRYLHYEIRLKGHLDSRWADWFDGLTITLKEDGDTLLSGWLVDQAALHGLLKKVRDLGLSLVSVNPVEPGPSAVSPLRGSGATGQGNPPEVKSYDDTHPCRSKKEIKNERKP
jgi:hypothetical protein